MTRAARRARAGRASGVVVVVDAVAIGAMQWRHSGTDILRHDFDDDDDDDDAGCVDARTCVGIIRSRAAHE